MGAVPADRLLSRYRRVRRDIRRIHAAVFGRGRRRALFGGMRSEAALRALDGCRARLERLDAVLARSSARRLAGQAVLGDAGAAHWRALARAGAAAHDRLYREYRLLLRLRGLRRSLRAAVLGVAALTVLGVAGFLRGEGGDVQRVQAAVGDELGQRRVHAAVAGDAVLALEAGVDDAQPVMVAVPFDLDARIGKGGREPPAQFVVVHGAHAVAALLHSPSGAGPSSTSSTPR